MSKESKTEYQFKGFSKPTYTQVPDELFDELLSQLSGSELKVLLYIMRRTFGFKKDSDNISLSQMLTGIRTKDGRILDHGTGLARSTLISCLKSLSEKNIVISEQRRDSQGVFEPSNYRLNVLNGRDPEGSTKNELPQFDKRTTLVRKSNPQQDSIQDTEYNNNIVDILIDKGITAKAAKKLAREYPEALIREKIELLEYLEDSDSNLVRDNPAGYLRRAIEEDYQAPKKFKKRAKRKAKADQQKDEDQENRRLEHQERTDRVEQAFSKYETSGELIEMWEGAKTDLRGGLTKATYDTYLAQAVLLSLSEDAAVVGVGNEYARQWVESRLADPVERALEDKLGRAVNIQVVVY